MEMALRQKTVVRPGGVIEIRSPDLPVGATAEVIVIVEAPAEPEKTPEAEAPRAKTPEELGWPPGFFEQTAGSLPDFPNIEPEGDYEVREELG